MKILLVSLAGIGNTLLVTPLIELLRKRFTKEKIYVLVMLKGAKELLERNPNLDGVILWNFLKEGVVSSFRFLLNLRKENFDYSILSYPANRLEYNIINFIVGKKERVAHRYNHLFYTNLGFLNTRLIREDDKKHDVEENVRLLSLLGIHPESFDGPRIYLTDEDDNFAGRFFKDLNTEKKLIIGMHAGTATFKNQMKRRWDKEKFGELGKIFVERDSAVVLIFGGKEEGELKTFIRDSVGDGAYTVDNTSIRETSALIKRCRLFVSADSGLMHIAASFGVPCVAIFGPTNPEWVYPYGTKYMIVRKDLPCSPCFYYSQRPLRCKFGDFRCIESISVDDVLEATEKLLKETEY